MIATLTASTSNRKLTSDPRARRVSVTRAAQASCPTDCPFLQNGCYAEQAHAGIHSARLNAAAELATPRDVARAEARAILADWPRDGRPLRLHEVGDCRTRESARIVARAVERAQSEGAGASWAYTHAWRRVERSDWGAVSILASCERSADASAADARGYGVALVAPDWEAGEARARAAGLRGVRCPAQTGAAPDCASCRLCFRADRLRDARAAILFAPHGSGARRVREATA